MEKVPQTLGEFIELTGSAVRIFDMGRRIYEISDDNFATFEKAQTPYPYPFKQEALFGIVLSKCPKEHKSEQSVWFLKFPLDEMGLLIQVARDDFLNRLLEKAILDHDATEQNEKIDAALKDNPYSFTPNPDRMAVFHAKVACALKTAPSQYYDHARQYFKGENGFEQWKFVGLQGIADMTSRLSENEEILSEAISSLPPEPFAILSSCLEHEIIGQSLTKAISSRILASLQSDTIDSGQVALAIRAISCSSDKTEQRRVYQTVIESLIGTEPEILSSISGKGWESLEEPVLLGNYLEKLAQSGQGCFNPLIADLLYLPSMRLLVMQSLRNKDCSEALTAAIGVMFKKEVK